LPDMRQFQYPRQSCAPSGIDGRISPDFPPYKIT
jgi:hypothetical protein